MMFVFFNSIITFQELRRVHNRFEYLTNATTCCKLFFELPLNFESTVSKHSSQTKRIDMIAKRKPYHSNMICKTILILFDSE